VKFFIPLRVYSYVLVALLGLAFATARLRLTLHVRITSRLIKQEARRQAFTDRSPHIALRLLVSIRFQQPTPPPACPAQSFATRIADGDFSAPRYSFCKSRISASKAADTRSGWNRPLATTFRSPVTTARFQATIPGSKFPACRFDALLDLPQARSACDSFALSG